VKSALLETGARTCGRMRGYMDRNFRRYDEPDTGTLARGVVV
jgi:hypothetical protein